MILTIGITDDQILSETYGLLHLILKTLKYIKMDFLENFVTRTRLTVHLIYLEIYIACFSLFKDLHL